MIFALPLKPNGPYEVDCRKGIPGTDLLKNKRWSKDHPFFELTDLKLSLLYNSFTITFLRVRSVASAHMGSAFLRTRNYEQSFSFKYQFV
jgi:hypothetical protein